MASAASMNQPFQPPEEQCNQIEKEIQEIVTVSRCSLPFIYFVVHEYIVVVIQFLNGSGKPYRY